MRIKGFHGVKILLTWEKDRYDLRSIFQLEQTEGGLLWAIVDIIKVGSQSKSDPGLETNLQV